VLEEVGKRNPNMPSEKCATKKILVSGRGTYCGVGLEVHCKFPSARYTCYSTGRCSTHHTTTATIK
jgi:hypothetical protein